MKDTQRLIALFFVLAAFSYASAQNKLLTLDNIFSPDPNVRVQFDGNPAELEWTKDGKSFKQIREGKLMRVDAMTGEIMKSEDD